MVDTPEIKALHDAATKPDPHSITRFEPFVPLSDAIQAVRDTEDRISAEVITDPFAGREDEIRREAVREIVEALREAAQQIPLGDRSRDSYNVAIEQVRLIERTFLNGEGSDGE